MICCRRSPCLLLALPLLCLFGKDVVAEQRTACFDVIAASSEIAPAGAILLNRCNGQSWVLTRTYQAPAKGNPAYFAYRWTAIAGDLLADARPAPSPPAPAVAGDKCFTFQGRRFCE